MGWPVGWPDGDVGCEVGCPEGCPVGWPVGCPDGSTGCTDVRVLDCMQCKREEIQCMRHESNKWHCTWRIV